MTGLDDQLLSDGSWSLNADKPAIVTLLVHYRNLNCPICLKSLEELNGLIEDFAALGVAVLALSGGSRERAE